MLKGRSRPSVRGITVKQLLLALFSLIVLTTPLLAQDKKVEIIERKNNAGQVVERYRTVDGTRDGDYQSWHDNGTPSSSGAYRTGQQHGAWSYFHDNGKTYYTMTFEAGNAQGVAKVYWPEGNLRIDTRFDMGYQKGAYTSYHANGNVEAKGEVYSSNHNSLWTAQRTGPWKDYHANGQLAYDWSWDKNNLHGAATAYYEDGVKRITTSFENGYQKGSYTAYHNNGKVQAQGEVYTSNHNSLWTAHRTGPWKDYHANGQLAYDWSWDKNNLHGAATAYYEDGVKRLTTSFENGYQKGAYTSYHANGNVEAKGEVYTSNHNSLWTGHRTGPWEDFHASGGIFRRAAFKQNLWHGQLTEYYEDGTKRIECPFTDGKAFGTRTYYHPNGKKSTEGEVSDSPLNNFWQAVLEGLHTDWYASGVVSSHTNYRKGVRHGDKTDYFESGNKRVHATFVDGTMSGKWTSWHDSGHVDTTGHCIGQNHNSINHPIQSGLWTSYFENGMPSFEGVYAAGLLDGKCTWYHANGTLQYETEWTEGRMRGSWTGWWDNGKKSAHGHCTDANWSSPNNPVRQGPWVHYHRNGNKESEGAYRDNVKTGTWIYYDVAGAMREVKVHGADGQAKDPQASGQQPDGTTKTVIQHPDGSKETLTFDKDGKLIDKTKELPEDKKKPYVIMEDEDGNKTILTYDEDGNPKTTTSKTETLPDGTKHTTEKDSDGTVRDIYEKPDGSRTVKETRPDGATRTTEKAPDGTVKRHYDMPDGSTRDYTYNPDGSATRERRDAEGNLLDTTKRDPSGVEHMELADGTKIRRFKDDDGNTVETRTTPDGDTTRTVRDPSGRVIERQDTVGEREPGQGLYEDYEGGKDWDSLSESEKAKYAKAEKDRFPMGIGDEIYRRKADNDLGAGADASADLDAAKDAAEKDLKCDPADKGAEELLSKEGLEGASKLLSILDWALNLPDVPLDLIQVELSNALDAIAKAETDPDKRAAAQQLVKDLMATDRRGLASFLNKHPGILNAWEKYIKPAANIGTSIMMMAVNAAKAVDAAERGEWAEAFTAFLDGGIAGMRLIPPGTMAKIDRDLGANPSSYMGAIKNLISFSVEANRKLKPGEYRNWGTLLNEGVQFVLNTFKSLPDAQRKHFIERQIPGIRNLLGKIEDGVPGAKAVLGLIDSTPAIYKLIAEWNTPAWADNMTAVAQKVGPKVIGLLVKIQTGSDKAADAAEFLAQMGTDAVASYWVEVRKIAEGRMKSVEQEVTAYNNFREATREAARQAGMSQSDQLTYEFVANFACGHTGRRMLSTWLNSKEYSAVQEAMAAYRRVNAGTGQSPGLAGYFTANLQDQENRSDEAEYQRWKEQQLTNARRTIRFIDGILAEYAIGSASRRFLTAWRDDLAHIVSTFG